MCPPNHFSIEYSINPWMKGEDVDINKAHKQWNFLKSFLEDLGAEVKTIDPHPDYPDMVFTANAGVVHNNSVVLSNFKHKERQGEKAHFRKWFEENEYEVHELPEDMIFEGRGDCFVYRNYLIGGYGQRSEKKSITRAAEILELIPVTVELKDPKFYHIDTCLSIVSEQKGMSIYYPKAFNKNFEKEMSKIDLNLIPVTEKEAKMFACNSVSLKNAVVMPKGCERISLELDRHGYVSAPVPMSEFMKSGGACRCLVLEI